LLSPPLLLAPSSLLLLRPSSVLLLRTLQLAHHLLIAAPLRFISGFRCCAMNFCLKCSCFFFHFRSLHALSLCNCCSLRCRFPRIGVLFFYFAILKCDAPHIKVDGMRKDFAMERRRLRL